MRVIVTERKELSTLDLRPTSELAPSLALPWLMRLRYGLLIGQVVLILLAAFGAKIPLPLGWLAIPLSVTLLSNLFQQRLMRRYDARSVLGLSLTLDILSLTAVLALSGGPANPFSLLYLVQITLSAVVLSRTWTWSLGALSVACFGFLFLAHLPILALEGHHPAQGFSVHLYGMWIAFVTAALLITIFIGKVSEILRSHEQELLRLQSQLARNEKVASIATMAAGAAHELGTPLATIAIVARELEIYAEKHSQDGNLLAEAKLIREEVERCRKILNGMSAQGAEMAGEAPSSIRIDDFLASLCQGIHQYVGEQLRLSMAPDLTVQLPVESARKVLTALAQNAFDSGEGVEVELGCERVGETLRFFLKDSGSGMSAETLSHIAEPFFTTKPPGKGMGLGTFLARVFAENMGGALVYESTPGKGTTAILELPIVTPDGK
jgi:two-component system sensor histidine kinase RegB